LSTRGRSTLAFEPTITKTEPDDQPSDSALHPRKNFPRSFLTVNAAVSQGTGLIQLARTYALIAELITTSQPTLLQSLHPLNFGGIFTPESPMRCITNRREIFASALL